MCRITRTMTAMSLITGLSLLPALPALAYPTAGDEDRTFCEELPDAVALGPVQFEVISDDECDTLRPITTHVDERVKRDRGVVVVIVDLPGNRFEVEADTRIDKPDVENARLRSVTATLR